jgi:hypothetical protein
MYSILWSIGGNYFKHKMRGADLYDTSNQKGLKDVSMSLGYEQAGHVQGYCSHGITGEPTL